MHSSIKLEAFNATMHMMNAALIVTGMATGQGNTTHGQTKRQILLTIISHHKMVAWE